MDKFTSETPMIKSDQIEALASKYGFEPWMVQILDMQRCGLKLTNPPRKMLPEELRQRFQFATLTLQAKGFTFTTSELSPGSREANHLDTPYSVTVLPEIQGTVPLSLAYEGLPVDMLDPLRLMKIMGKPSTHYFAYKGSGGESLPIYLVVNPNEHCAFRCRYCSRLPFLRSPSPGIPGNISATIREVLCSGVAPEEVKFISIITGSTSSPEGDLALCRAVTTAFREMGFEHCEYGFYSSTIQCPADMRLLADMGVIFFTFTIETTTRQARQRLHGPGNPKRNLEFDEIITIIQQAEDIFPHVNTTLMLGYEPAGLIKGNLELLAGKTCATVNHYIPRLWLKGQSELIHPSARNLDYYVDLCAFIEQVVNSRRKTIGSFFKERFGIPTFRLRYRS